MPAALLPTIAPGSLRNSLSLEDTSAINTGELARALVSSGGTESHFAQAEALLADAIILLMANESSIECSWDMFITIATAIASKSPSSNLMADLVFELSAKSDPKAQAYNAWRMFHHVTGNDTTRRGCAIDLICLSRRAGLGIQCA